MTNMKMMSKEDFLKVLMGLLENQGIKTSVFIMKKEHGSYTGIHRVSDNDGETIAAIVNVDDLYDKFIHGKAGVPEMLDIAMEAMNILSMYPSQSAPDSLKWLSDWSVVKNRMFLSLCNKNAVEYLNSVIHKDIPGTDLALVPRIFAFDDGKSFATLPLSHKNLKSYGVSEEELWNHVAASTVKLQPAKIDIAAARHQEHGNQCVGFIYYALGHYYEIDRHDWRHGWMWYKHIVNVGDGKNIKYALKHVSKSIRDNNYRRAGYNTDVVWENISEIYKILEKKYNSGYMSIAELEYWYRCARIMEEISTENGYLFSDIKSEKILDLISENVFVQKLVNTEDKTVVCKYYQEKMVY